MTRRALLLLACVPPLLADAADDAWSLLRSAASALTTDDAPAFLACLDPNMSGYGQISDNATALVREAEVNISIELISNEGGAGSRTLEVNWLMDIVNITDRAQTHRRADVRIQVEKKRGKWLITSFEPADLFAPVKGAGRGNG